MTRPQTSLALKLSERLYGILLLAYPRPFRREYGEPMMQLFGDCCAEALRAAGYVLRGLSVSLRRARRAAALSRNPASRSAGGADFVTALIRCAEAEARRLGHPFVGTEHLLLGLMSEQKPALEAFFDSLGVSAELVRRDTLHVIGAAGG
jgi:hypothetical protein